MRSLFKPLSMKNTLLFAIFYATIAPVCAQIQLEHTYPQGILSRINLDVSGEAYLLKPHSCAFLFFDKAHEPFYDVYIADGVYFSCGDNLISEKLLDTDDKIEIIYTWFEDGMCLASGTSVWDNGENMQITPSNTAPILSSDFGSEPKILLTERVFSVPGPVLEHFYGYDSRVSRTFFPVDGERYIVYNWNEFNGFHFYKPDHNLAKSVYLPMWLNHVTQQYFNDDDLLEFFGVQFLGSNGPTGNQFLTKIIREDGVELLSEPCQQQPVLSNLPNFPDRLMIRSHNNSGQLQEKILDVKSLSLLHTFPSKVSRVSPDGATAFYVRFSEEGDSMSLYFDNFTFFKNIVLPYPVDQNSNFGITRYRFTQSGKLEIYYSTKNDTGPGSYQVVCIDEDGALLHTFPGAYSGVLDQQPGMDDKFFVRYLNQVNTEVYDFVNQSTSVTPVESGVFRVYPNPFSQSFRVQLPQQGSCQLRLTDIAGRVMMTGNIQNQTSGEFDVAPDLPAGIYFLAINGPDFQSVLRLIKK